MKLMIYIVVLLIMVCNFPVYGNRAAHCKIDANLPRFDLNASKTTVVPLERSTPTNSPHQIICENAEITIYTEKGDLILVCLHFRPAYLRPSPVIPVPPVGPRGPCCAS